MILGDSLKVIEAVEHSPDITGRDAVLRGLRSLCFEDFALFTLGMPDVRFPRISALMPAMASDEVQRKWTGCSGTVLLSQSIAFVRAVWHRYERVTGRPLADATVLDYGCGYGRLLRLLRYMVDDARLFGCDPWDKALELCREARIANDLQQTDYLPARLPYGDAGFDLIYAFSVFTHTSPAATAAALGALRQVLRPEGLLAITIRPVEYWDVNPGDLPLAEVAELKRRHAREGCAFRPHPNQPSPASEGSYGDVSMSPAFIETSFPGWRIAVAERTLSDPYQKILYMQPRQ